MLFPSCQLHPPAAGPYHTARGACVHDVDYAIDTDIRQIIAPQQQTCSVINMSLQEVLIYHLQLGVVLQYAHVSLSD